MSETHLFICVILLVVSSNGSAVVWVWEVGKVMLPNVYNNILSGFDRHVCFN
jgi:hypothetical protein